MCYYCLQSRGDLNVLIIVLNDEDNCASLIPVTIMAITMKLLTAADFVGSISTVIVAVAEGVHWGTVGLVAVRVVRGTLCAHTRESHRSVRVAGQTGRVTGQGEPTIRESHQSGRVTNQGESQVRESLQSGRVTSQGEPQVREKQ